MRQTNFRALFFFILIAATNQAAQRAEAATINAAGCALSAVQAAVNAAAENDTVLVPAGACTWSGTLAIQNKTITLRGAGSGVSGTKISHGGGNYTLLVVDPGSKTGRVDISGFHFFGGAPDNWNGTVMRLGGPNGWKNLRVHHNIFEDNYPWTLTAEASTYGLIDNNSFRGRAFGMKTYGSGESDWAKPLTLGTADFLFVENNVFDYDDFYGSTGVPALDMNNGGRVVFRNNTLRYAFFETHDKARSGLVSANAYEIYRNEFWTNSNKWKGVDLTAGTGVVWGNTFTGDWTIPIGAMDYKTDDPRSVPRCNGSDPADQNTPGESGWRCQYQIGSVGEGRTATGYPLYVWSNSENGTAVGMECTMGCTHVKSGRDFINNGTQAKSGYAQYRYPHPLAGDTSTPQPPTEVQVN